MRKIIAIIALALMASTPHARGQVCENGKCPLIVTIPDSKTEGQLFDESEMMEVRNAQARGPSDRVAVKVTNGRSCGSGAIVGRDSEGSTIITNAHVAGTRIGRQVRIDYVDSKGVARRTTGRVTMAAYSEKYLTDWAIVKTSGFNDVEPVRMSTQKPSGWHYTRGSPRCVWPQVSTAVKTANVADNSPLWRWRPNSIGGQSGSAVWSTEDNLQYGLLTWSWGGLGAGQQTHWIHRQATTRTIVGPLRAGGLKEVAENVAETEEGFFSEAGATKGITDLDIWDDGTGGGSEPDECPECDDEGSDDEKKMFKRIREKAKERNVNLLKLLDLILEIIALFSSGLPA